MLNCDVIDQKLQPSVRTWRSRLRGYLARRSRQLLRLMLIVVIALLFMAGILEAWRGASLVGLPDIGDPFDVAQFRAFRVPPENDSFVLLPPGAAEADRLSASSARGQKTRPDGLVEVGTPFARLGRCEPRLTRDVPRRIGAPGRYRAAGSRHWRR